MVIFLISSWIGIHRQVDKPEYDSQEAIYTDILKELETATAALDATKPRVTREVMYAGDIVKWKRFGNSLLLRAAMRLSKIKPTIASGYVTKAVAGRFDAIYSRRLFYSSQCKLY
jgi:hypothetical protein